MRKAVELAVCLVAQWLAGCSKDPTSGVDSVQLAPLVCGITELVIRVPKVPCACDVMLKTMLVEECGDSKKKTMKSFFPCQTLSF